MMQKRESKNVYLQDFVTKEALEAQISEKQKLRAQIQKEIDEKMALLKSKFNDKGLKYKKHET